MANNLAIGLVIGASLQSGFQAAFSKTENALKRVNQAIAKGTERQQGLSAALVKLKQRQKEAVQAVTQARMSGGNLANAITQYRRLSQQIKLAEQKQLAYANALKRAEAIQSKLNQALIKQQDQHAYRQELKGKALGTLGFAISAAAPIKAAIDFESAMADVKKVVDFDTPEGFKKLSKEILELTNTLPMTAEQLATITATGGQLGVAEKDLKAFTTTIAKMSVAFDMSADESADAMAKLANVYAIPINEIDKLGDAINELSNNNPAKAEQIVKVLGRIGGTAKDFGLTQNAATALSSAFISLGKPAEVAGTAINGMLTKLATADKGGKKFQEALSIIGISAKQLKANIAKDGEKALVDFLNKVAKLPKSQRTGILVDIFGLEYADDVSLLAGNVNVLEKQLGLLKQTDQNGQASYLGSMSKEFSARAATTAGQLQTLKNGISALAITIGTTLLPALTQIVEKIKPIVQSFTNWAEQHPTLVKGLMGFVSGLVGLKVATLGVQFLFSGLISTFNGVNIALNSIKALHVCAQILQLSGCAGSLAKAFGVVKTAVFALGRAMLANPILLIVTAIAGAAYLIYQYWEPIKGFFSHLWQNLKDFFTSGIGNITQTILNWSPFGLFYKAFSKVLGWFGIELPNNFSEFGKNIIDGLVNGISNAWNTAKEKVSELGTGVKNWFKEKLGIHSPSRVFMGFGQNTVEGLAIGITQKTALANKASDNLAQSVTQSSKKLDISTEFANQESNEQIRSNYRPLSESVTFPLNSAQQEPSRVFNINFNPTINLTSHQDSVVLNQVKQGLNMSLTEFEKMLDRVLDQRQRRAY